MALLLCWFAHPRQCFELRAMPLLPRIQYRAVPTLRESRSVHTRTQLSAGVEIYLNSGIRLRLAKKK